MDTAAKVEASIRRGSDHERDRFGRELGIPEAVQVLFITMDAGTLKSEWAGYVLEFIGDEAPPPFRRKSATGATSATDFLRDYIYAELEGVGIRVWCVRVRHSDAQAYLEARTRPGWAGFTSIDLRDLDPSNRGDSERMLTKGMAMLYPRVYRSRPPGTGRFTTAQEFHEAYRDALAALRRQNVKPRVDLICREMGISRSSFYGNKASFGPGD